MKLTVGPAPGSFGPRELGELYREVASSSADEMYLGELGCAKRFHSRELLDAAGELRAAGKVVFASSPALVTPSRRFLGFERLVEVADGVEINSPAFLRRSSWQAALADSKGAVGRRWVAGPFLNIYSLRAAELVERLGAFRVVAPVDSAVVIGQGLLRPRRAPVEVEVTVYGYVPLAFSARCLSARRLGRAERECGRACLEHQTGIALESEGNALFRIDGPVTLSGRARCAVRQLPVLRRAGVGALRIMPVPGRTGRIVELLRGALDGRMSPDEAASKLAEVLPGGRAGRRGRAFSNSRPPTGRHRRAHRWSARS